jgi:phage terminase small subunit
VKLNPKQKRFVEEYLIDLNATQAAIRAGYSNKTAQEQSSRLLSNVMVQAGIQEAMKERSKRTEITADRVLQELAHIAFDDVRNYLSFRQEKQLIGFDESEEAPVPIYEYMPIIDIKDSETIDTRNISEVSLSKKDGFKFKMYCKDHALVNLGKHLGLFKENLNVTGNIGVTIVDDVNDED